MWLKKTDVVCITGGASGLGAELAREFSSRGCAVAVIDIIRPALADLVPTVRYLSADVRDLDAMTACAGTIADELGTVTVLINNAAVRRPWTPILYEDVADMQCVLDVNLMGVLLTTKLFLTGMTLRERGTIVFVSSALSMQSPAGLATYGASKAGLVGIYESITGEFSANEHIKTLLVCPGQLDTEMFGDITTPSRLIAPVVNKTALAKRIVLRVEKGGEGFLYTPFYVHFLPVMRIVPYTISRRLRKLSGMDDVHPGQRTRDYT
ncbi:hypothetical protein B9G98_03590 [Wickerhamiella sorbophila]|uniref:Uncharacterized protein n=1 Tax=Wickerhamiella sorbophila TaxID=45607 RepID=A0A2T0FLW6_9ASCO|nr:hypothetical protein B9G98_03590 [Wickerhamiella sorbophila]PRT55970.1 hypothetical protein B9G98_03590 [Wickerhamiella sorbophila]